VKAIASGNPAVLTLAEADAELQRLTMLKKNHADEQYIARRSARDLPGIIAGLTQRLAALCADRDTAMAYSADAIVVDGQPCTRDEALDLLARRLDSLPRFVTQRQRLELGVYHGLRFGVLRHPNSPPEVYLEGAVVQQSMLPRDHHGPRAVLNALERLGGAYGAECARIEQDLHIAETQLRDHRARIGQPFRHEGYLSELTALRNKLQRALSAPSPEKARKTGKIVERIKALTAQQVIDAAPQRVGMSRRSAEESLTARIRRRMEPSPARGIAG
jgi:hypothetical protein